MSYAAAGHSLQDLLDRTPDLVGYFRNDTRAPHNRNRPGPSPVPAEVTNWRDEQRAWRETAVLFDQTHHMPEMFLEGPGARALLERVGINSLVGFGPGRAKQFIACNHEGFVIGECVLHCLGDQRFELISGMQLQNWVAYNAEVGGYDVTITRDMPTAEIGQQRVNFRFGMDGPNAEKVFVAAVEGVAPDMPFFHTAMVRIAGVEVMALRHGMAGHKGVELSGPFAQGERVRAALMAAGAEYRLTPAGRLAYFSTPSEGGWMAYPLPAVYTDPGLADFRRWLPDDGWEARAQLAGSLCAPLIADYYVTPWDMGVHRVMKFDHDFIGRTALERMAQAPHRRKVTLVWNPDDVLRIQASFLQPGEAFKSIEVPVASYGFPQADAVRDGSGGLIGRSGFAGYSTNERAFLSLATVNAEFAEPGTKVLLDWGEPDGGSRKPQVERHRQTTIRCTVAPAPYAAAVRAMKKDTLTARTTSAAH